MNMLTSIDHGRADRPAAETATHPAWRRAGWLALPVLAAAGAWALLAHDGSTAAAPPPLPTVTVAAPLVRDVTQWDDYVGRFEASKSVEVRPRVSGAITGVHFADGAIVQRGQLLFSLDARPFAAALAEARAAVASSASDLALARANYERGQRLIGDDAVSKSDLDQLAARVRSAGAGLAAAQARVRARALDVEFTRIRAPISGRISDRRVDSGNLVSAGDTGGTLLTTINALDPIYFTFDASEALFLKAKRAGAGGAAVQVRLQDEARYARTGRLDFTDNGLDPKSGTVRGRAVLSNGDLFLTPGMFGNMRLSNGGSIRALLVPDTAIVTDQARKTVMVVARDGSVAVKPVQLGPVVDGLRVVTGGLAPADRVVISGVQMVQPGGKVNAVAGRIAATPDRAAAAVAAAPAGEATIAR